MKFHLEEQEVRERTLPHPPQITPSIGIFPPVKEQVGARFDSIQQRPGLLLEFL